MELLFYILVLIIFIIPVWKICKKTGRNPALSLISVIPYLGVMILALLLAFGRWPSFDHVAATRRGAR